MAKVEFQSKLPLTTVVCKDVVIFPKKDPSRTKEGGHPQLRCILSHLRQTTPCQPGEFGVPCQVTLGVGEGLR